MFEMENRGELIEKIEDLVNRKRYTELRDLLLPLEPADIAILADDLDDEKTLPLLFRLLPKEQAAEVFVELESDQQELLIRGFSNTELKEVLDELYLDDTVDIVEEMPANVVKRILKHSDPDMRKSINEILKYPEDSTGSKETINVCYVIDDWRHLIGVLSIRTLLLAEEDDIIGDIMERNYICVQTLDDQEETARALGKYDFLALPVVDTEKPYLRTSAFDTFKSRIPWLLLLMVSATFTGQIISSFEDALSAFTILTAYIPMLMDTGGNCGSQASVTVIRGLSLGEIEFSDLIQVVWKECRVALLCGTVLAGANFAKLMLLDRMVFHNPITVTVAAVICLTLVCTVFAAKIVGCMLPLLAKKIGFDPAVMASPFITTIVDALSLLIYFRFASFLLGI